MTRWARVAWGLPRVLAALAWRGGAAHRILAALEVTVQREGGPVPEGPFVGVANHLGWLDAVVLAAEVPGVLVAKREVGEWPVLGPAIARRGTLFVDRERRVRVRCFLDAAGRRLGEGTPVIGFPEGSSTDGCRILRFKTGLFAAAIRARVPVLPMRLDLVTPEGFPISVGRRQLATWYGDKSFLPHLLWVVAEGGLRVRLRVGTPVSTEGRHRKELAASVRAGILAMGGLQIPRPAPAPLPALGEDMVREVSFA